MALSYLSVVLLWSWAVVYVIGASVTAPKKRLNDGREMPSVAYNSKYDLSETGDVAGETVGWALDAGYRHIDTSEYDETERQVGEALASKIADGAVKRDDVFITTKMWLKTREKQQVVPALRESLHRLGLDYVDLYLLHWPMALTANGSFSDVDYLESWQGLEEAKRLGLAHSIGVAHFNQAQFERLVKNAQTKPAVLLIEVNPTLTQEALVKYAQTQGVVVMAAEPEVLKATPAIVGTLAQLSEKYNKSFLQIKARYAIDRGLVPTVHLENKNKIEQFIDVSDFQLSAAEVATLGSYNADYRFESGDRWAAHPQYPF